MENRVAINGFSRKLFRRTVGKHSFDVLLTVVQDGPKELPGRTGIGPKVSTKYWIIVVDWIVWYLFAYVNICWPFVNVFS